MKNEYVMLIKWNQFELKQNDKILSEWDNAENVVDGKPMLVVA